MGFRVGIVGATGVTGEVTLRILSERSFPVDELRLITSSRSAGRLIEWSGREFVAESIEDADFSGLDVIISATPSEIALEWVPRMAEAGPLVIDQSSAFRMDPNVPIVVPEVNADAAKTHKGVIAGPNCTTAVPLMAVAALQRDIGIHSIICSSYQSVSGGGRDGMTEFLEQSQKALDQVEALRGHERLDVGDSVFFPHPLAFNLFPHCETFPGGSDSSTEELKMEREMRKIFSAPDLLVHATAVRVPVLVSHSVSLALSLEREVLPAEAREMIDAFTGVKVVDEPEHGRYPMPIEAAGIDEVLVGRIRHNRVLPNGLSLFASGDNLRKGNALNAIQTAELVLGVTG